MMPDSRKKWLVIADGTQTYSGSRKLNERCLERHYNKGTDEETVNYHCDVLEAKNISSELSAGFGRQLTREDISKVEENNKSFN